MVVWICPPTLGPSGDVLSGDREGPQWAKGHFKDYEVIANRMVLLIVPFGGVA